MTVKKINETSIPNNFDDDIQKQKYINKRQSRQDNNEAWWINGAFVVVVHIISLITLLTYSAHYKTLVMTSIICNLGMLG
jgi:quinol-cytochrome oxidoreductase complex cytochrome b subunit